MLELPILGLLEEEPMHGYELKKRLDETVGVVAGVSYGSLYPALKRLEKAGAIEAIDPAEAAGTPIPATGSIGGETAAARVRRRLTTGKRKRKEYRITDRGREVLRELLIAEEDAGDDRAFALKLAFCRYLEPDDRIRLFERRRAWLSDKLARVRHMLTGTEPDGARGADDLYTRSLIEHDGESTQRDLEWVERLIESERRSNGMGEEAPQEHTTGEPAPAGPTHGGQS